MRWPIRSQLLLPLLVLLAGVAGISLWTAWTSASQARRQVEDRLRNVARFLSEDSSFPLNRDVLRKMKPLSGADFLLVQRSGRRASSLPRDPGPLESAEVFDDWQSLRLGPPVRLDGESYLCSGIRLRHGLYLGDTLYILYPESLWRDALQEAIRPSLVLGCSLGVASLALALVLARGVSRRIGELEQRTRLIAGGDFSPMPLPRRNDELRDLALCVNEMAEQLLQLQRKVQQSERLRLLGQVSGGLAHQMRNGLTGARLAVQLFVHEHEQMDTTALEVALRQLRLLEAHLKRFLELGHEGCLRVAAVSLRDLVQEAVDLLDPQCRHTGIELEWTPPASACPLVGDPGQMGQLILNVLSNAVEAAGPGGQVRVCLTPVPGVPPEVDRYHLDVFDTGPGPPPEIADRLFEPFVTGKPEGVGLGLAVARQVAAAHAGRISWSRVEGRTCFRVELPAENGMAGALQDVTMEQGSPAGQ
jgi:signal transduction histidine kinase